jgi:pyridoxal biosynthesis lyase PdxS
MKKHDAVERLERLGNDINDMNGRAWNTALHPTEFGWAQSIFSAATIPILSAASIGQMVSAAVVKQINPDVIEKLTEFPGKKGSDSSGPAQG